MYYLLFGFFYLVSLLPFGVLYFFSDIVAFFLYGIIRYRRQTVLHNISSSFPQKTDGEIKRIYKSFYRNFTDNWVETIKLISLSSKKLQERANGDAAILVQLAAEGKTVSCISGHFFNWEYLNAYLSLVWPKDMITVYMPLSSQPMERLLSYIRTRFGTHLMAAPLLNKEIIGWRRKQYMIGLVSDQSPANPANAFWMEFLGRPTPIVTGAERNAQVFSQVPVFITVSRVRRGYYQFQFSPVLQPGDNPKEKGLITKRLTHLTEQNIYHHPHLYLWSHRRWKHNWQPEFASLWIDDKALPAQAP
jgi:KDO2-lipid IV(A) lauroyltransferase